MESSFNAGNNADRGDRSRARAYFHDGLAERGLLLRYLLPVGVAGGHVATADDFALHGRLNQDLMDLPS